MLLYFHTLSLSCVGLCLPFVYFYHCHFSLGCVCCGGKEVGGANFHSALACVLLSIFMYIVFVLPCLVKDDSWREQCQQEGDDDCSTAKFSAFPSCLNFVAIQGQLFNSSEWIEHQQSLFSLTSSNLHGFLHAFEHACFDVRTNIR